MRKAKFFAAALLAMSSLGVFAQHQFTVQANKPGAEIQPTMYGIFFEDINFGADGGLYAEMVENRSFEFPQRLMGWNTFGNVTLSDVKPAFDRNPHYVTLESASNREDHHPHHPRIDGRTPRMAHPSQATGARCQRTNQHRLD